MRWRDTFQQTNTEQTATIPMRIVGPVKIISHEVNETVPLPLATLESPLWPSTHRGARTCTKAGGIQATIIDDRMTRSVVVETDTVAMTHRIYLEIQQQKEKLQTIVSETSRFAKLID